MTIKATRHRSSVDKAKVRQAMTLAAAELLVEAGYEGVTLAKVAKRVGFATTNIYRYFDSKDDLIYAAIEDGFVAFGERLEAAYRSTDDPLERILTLGRAYAQFAADYPVHYELMFVLKTDYLFGERDVPGVDKLGYLTKALGEAMAQGVIRQGNVQAMANTQWALLHGVITLSNAMPFIDDKQREEALEEAFTVTRMSLKPC